MYISTYRVSEKSGTIANYFTFILFTTYAVHGHPYALRIFSTAELCFSWILLNIFPLWFLTLQTL